MRLGPLALCTLLAASAAFAAEPTVLKGQPFSASPTSGMAPLTVTFSGVGSGIEFGDGTGQAKNDGIALNHASHIYSTAGTYTATSGSASAKITVTGHSAACPNIGYGINCARGYHAQTNYDSNGCPIQPTCVSN